MEDVLKRVKEVISSVPGVKEVSALNTIHVLTHTIPGGNLAVYEAEEQLMAEFPNTSFSFVCTQMSEKKYRKETKK